MAKQMKAKVKVQAKAALKNLHKVLHKVTKFLEVPNKFPEALLELPEKV